MSLQIILCSTLIPLAIISATIIFIKIRRSRKANQKGHVIQISTIQNSYNPNVYQIDQRLSTESFDISTINIEEQIEALRMYDSQSDASKPLPEYTKPPAYNPNFTAAIV